MNRRHSSYLPATADGSGAIDREELAPLLRQLGISVSAAMETEMLHILDLDCSGDVQREELVEWLQKASAAISDTSNGRKSAHVRSLYIVEWKAWPSSRRSSRKLISTS